MKEEQIKEKEAVVRERQRTGRVLSYVTQERGHFAESVGIGHCWVLSRPERVAGKKISWSIN